VEHGCDADFGSQKLRIGGDLEHGLGGDREQEVVDQLLVLIGDVGDLARQGEHDVEVAHGQKLGLPCGKPLPCRSAPGLRRGRLWHFGQCRLRQEL